MVLLVDPDYISISRPSHQTMTSTSAGSLSSDDDLEGGCNSSYYSSQEMDSSGRDESENKDTNMVSKFLPVRAGKLARRRSQCEQLSFRQRSSMSSEEAMNTNIDDNNNDNGSDRLPSASALATEPPGFRRWSTLVSSSNDGDLPKSIQFCPSATTTGEISHHCSPSSPSSSSSSSSSSSTKRPLTLFFSISLLLLLVIQHQHYQITSLQQELQITNSHRSYLEKSQSILLTQLNEREQSLNQFRHTHERMSKISRDLGVSMTQLREEKEESLKELERLRGVEKRVKWSEGRWERYVEGVGARSKRSVLEKFGQGPHHVELQVQLPHQDQEQEQVQTINIELAPLDMMPHSVHTFLEQVHLGAWDGTAFDVHAGHVLMARRGASSTFTSNDNDNGQQELKQEVPTVTFPEYNAQYPHDKYTIAFPANNNNNNNSQGADFYINLQNNNGHHSPRIDTFADNGNGSASSEEYYVEGEPCFGKIVDEESRRVVDMMDGLNTVSGEMGLLRDNSVVIRSARIVGKK